jgi:hypothetical protein
MSSMWAADPPTRCVWIWFLLMADPEGYVAAAVPGVAQQSGVTLDQAKAAIALLESPDPYSSTPDFEGRRIVKVPRGWHIVNFVAYRERAREEAAKARKRNWAAKKRAEQLQLPFTDEPDGVALASTCRPESTHSDENHEKVDAPKPKPKPKHLSSEGEDPPTPVIRVRPIVKDLDGWEPSAELRDEARIAGVQKFDDHLARLRLGPIGGQRGVFADDIDNYIRGCFGQWRAWEETDRAKDAQRSAATASPRRFGDAPVPVDPFEPDASQRAFAKKYGLDLEALMKGVLADHPQRSQSLSRKSVLGERLTVAAKQKLANHPVTGKLTREESMAWGSCPPGGAIPAISVAS